YQSKIQNPKSKTCPERSERIQNPGVAVALMGQLGEFQLQNIIALLQVEQQTGELLMEHGERGRGGFYFQDGAIIHAASRETGGFEAALEPFGWKSGKFHFEAS